jgi:hypothetical protein
MMSDEQKCPMCPKCGGDARYTYADNAAKLGCTNPECFYVGEWIGVRDLTEALEAERKRGDVAEEAIRLIVAENAPTLVYRDQSTGLLVDVPTDEYFGYSE